MIKLKQGVSAYLFFKTIDKIQKQCSNSINLYLFTLSINKTRKIIQFIDISQSFQRIKQTSDSFPLQYSPLQKLQFQQQFQQLLLFYTFSKFCHLINKMIRYVSEKQVDMNRKTNSLKERVSQPKLEKARSTSEVPEDEENSSKALKKLKKINDYKEMLRGRLSVLQIQEEKNEFKAFLNEHRYQFHQQMMNDLERERDEKAEHLRRVHQKVMESHEKAKFERISHHLNLKNAQDELKKSRGSDYEETKTRRSEIEKNLDEMRRQESNFKRQRKLQIRNYEHNQKANVQQYFKNKIQEMKSTDGQQIEKISRVKEERAKQIDELSKLESIMLQKQARSKMSSLESEQRLKKLLNGSKTSSTHTTKLPSLSPEKRQQTDQDILLI